MNTPTWINGLMDLWIVGGKLLAAHLSNNPAIHQPMLAQADLTGVPAAVFKWVIIILVGLAVAAAFIWTAFRTGGKQNVRIDQDPTPEFRKAPKRYNHDLAEERHRDLTRRLTKAEQDIKDIQESRLKAIHGIERRFNRIWIVLTKIATKMDIETPTDEEENL